MSDSLEIAISGVYLQSAGTAMPATADGPRDLPGPGASFELQLGYRRTPNLVLAGYGTLGGISDGYVQRHAAVWTAGIKAEWHFAPALPIDPFVGFGAGVKALWLDNADMSQRAFGVELAKLQAGIDYRVSPSFAIGLSVGLSASTYSAVQNPTTRRFEAIDSTPVSWTLQAGPTARFDWFAAGL
jgi:hypothetical protein